MYLSDGTPCKTPGVLHQRVSLRSSCSSCHSSWDWRYRHHPKGPPAVRTSFSTGSLCLASCTSTTNTDSETRTSTTIGGSSDTRRCVSSYLSTLNPPTPLVPPHSRLNGPPPPASSDTTSDMDVEVWSSPFLVPTSWRVQVPDRVTEDLTLDEPVRKL